MFVFALHHVYHDALPTSLTGGDLLAKCVVSSFFLPASLLSFFLPSLPLWVAKRCMVHFELKFKPLVTQNQESIITYLCHSQVEF